MSRKKKQDESTRLQKDPVRLTAVQWILIVAAIVIVGTALVRGVVERRNNRIVVEGEWLVDPETWEDEYVNIHLRQYEDRWELWGVKEDGSEEFIRNGQGDLIELIKEMQQSNE